MGKPLRSSPPTSSVARLLDLDVAARAVASPSSAPRESGTAEAAQSRSIQFAEAPPPRPARSTMGETPSIKRELVLTRSADETLTRLVDTFRHATRARLTTSHAMRALLKAVAMQLDLIEREARRIGPLRLPSNARGREFDRDRFEALLADAVLAAMRQNQPSGPGDGSRTS